MFEGNTMLAAIAARTDDDQPRPARRRRHLPQPGAAWPRSRRRSTSSRAAARCSASAPPGSRRSTTPTASTFPPLKERFERLEDALQHLPRDVHAGRRDLRRASTTASTSAFNNPKPIRGDIPILIGGSGEKKTLRIVAQYADGSNLFGDVAHVKHLLGVLEGHCEDVGRDPAEITKTRMGARLHRAHARGGRGEARRRGREVQRPRPRARARRSSASRTRSPSRSRPTSTPGLDGITFSMPDVHDTRDGRARGRDARGGDRDTRPGRPRRTSSGSPRSASPVLRNLEITYAYSLLAADGRGARRPGANWCTFATWASRQAGRTIRGEDAIDFLRGAAGRGALAAAPAATRSGAGCCGAGCSTRRRGWDGFMARLHTPFDAVELASDAVARGNLKVFAEIGHEFARYLTLDFDAFIATVEPRRCCARRSRATTVGGGDRAGDAAGEPARSGCTSRRGCSRRSARRSTRRT